VIVAKARHAANRTMSFFEIRTAERYHDSAGHVRPAVSDCASLQPPLESRAFLLMSETDAKPRIAIGSDHAGFPVKEAIRKYLEAAGYPVDDQGTWSEESVDYPDYGKAVGERVASKQADLGIAVCGSGIGISIAANKVSGIRAALAHDVMTARLAREHNDANVLALGGRVVTRSRRANGSNFPYRRLSRRPSPAPPR